MSEWHTFRILGGKRQPFRFTREVHQYWWLPCGIPLSFCSIAPRPSRGVGRYRTRHYSRGRKRVNDSTSDLVKDLPSPVASGVSGLDDILGGGFTANRLYLIEWEPGSGNPTLSPRS